MPDPLALAAIADAALAQKRVATPATSAWVAANAGSGKTRVLTERVARLLLAGAAPERILCLTYTRSAAAEMANRLSTLLGGWALLPDAALRTALAGLDEAGDAATLSTEALAQARRLFARALETPGGLKIQTIHAFCGAALRRFPLEAGVSPDFRELDTPAQAQLIQRAIERLAEAAEAGEDDSFDGVAADLGEEGMADLVQRILSQRALFAEPPAPRAICAAFGLAESDLDSDPLASFWRDFDTGTAAEALAALEAQAGTNLWLAKPLRAALQTDDPAALQAVFLTGKGEPRSFASPPTKPVATAHPWLPVWLRDLAPEWLAAAAQADAIHAAGRAIALNGFGAAILQAYEAEKRARAALDFDDLIAHMLALLADPGAGAWALYKLDGGIDHLLVDEAQDTSPAQWELVRALGTEFAAGAGAREGRTLFVVGDEKQSIYSFQGAAPDLFGENAAWFAERLATSPRPLLRGTLTTSFRSSPAILQAVDATFKFAPEGLSAEGTVPVHLSAHPGRGGRVDLWPVIEPEPAEKAPPWDTPVDAPKPGDPRVLLAETIAAEVARLWRERVPLPGAGRAVSPGDVLILLRRRGTLAPALVRALKRQGVPVAGADRIRIADELAVRDLLALARWALTPGDDLSLAAVLRSPLCSLSEEALFALAQPRTGPLWAALRAAPAHAEPTALLTRMRDRADFLRPFEFFDTVLTPEGGRHRLLARLGIEAEEAIDELLAQALAYEAGHTPSLEGFLAWLGQAGIDIKREQDKGADAVRVMTVHGAKGLEAPLVILPDTLGARERVNPVLALEEGFAAWRGGQADALRRAQELARARAMEENRRLLYVAMTRAEHWLIVAGAGRPPKTDECWHGLIMSGLADLGAQTVPGPDALPGPVLRLENGATPALSPDQAETAAPEPTLPDWASTAPRAAPPSPTRIAASALAGDETGHGGEGDAALARLRGTAIHALLEELPALPRDDRTAHAMHLLARLAPEAADAHDAWRDEALATLALPQAAAFFSAEALAEVSLSWTAPDGRRIAGRIDRLHPGPPVHAVDFKTDAAPPDSPDAVPEGYLRQMAAYEAALAALYPQSDIAVSLLWTRTGQLMTLPPNLLAAARTRIACSA